MITDTAGNIVWTWNNLDPFGNNPPNENPLGLGAFKFNKRFANQYSDVETGTNYNFFRDCYDPATGRYCQSDPIGLMGGINTFAYALSNPLRYADPTGLDTYIVNRDLAAFGDSAHPITDVVTHTFTFSTNPDGSIAHTYSWGNDANLKGWNSDQPIDMKAAAQALQHGLAAKVAPAFMDSYYRKAFDQLNKPENEHSNWVVTNNCKKETEELNDLAWKLWAGGK